jgi:hypothetical protein
MESRSRGSSSLGGDDQDPAISIDHRQRGTSPDLSRAIGNEREVVALEPQCKLLSERASSRRGVVGRRHQRLLSSAVALEQNSDRDRTAVHPDRRPGQRQSVARSVEDTDRLDGNVDVIDRARAGRGMRRRGHQTRSTHGR